MENLINAIVSNAALLLTVIGVLAFIVSVIIESTKNLAIFKRIPTDALVLVTSLLLCVTAYCAYASYMHVAIVWYYIVGAIIISFIVSFIAMFGWDKFTALWLRFKQ